MNSSPQGSLKQRLKHLVFGRTLSPTDESVFHKLSLIAFFAWVGLGADGLSSSCYGPAEAYLALGEHTYLAVFVGLATSITVMIISSSYSQIIELFPTGGGGYVVATKLLSPTVGMISGCALLIDYVLTITLSLASGADAIFSFLPREWHSYKLEFALFGVLGMTILNLRGVKESVLPLIPIFMAFLLTHAFAILYGLATHLMVIPEVSVRIANDLGAAGRQLGWWGVALLMLKAYSMGAGTFTGIEAVSNGLPILREPKVQTGKRTMLYMAVSLSVTVLGLFLIFILYKVEAQTGKTLNAVVFENLTGRWSSPWGTFFVLITLLSEALLLYVAAQAGFIDGPRVLANMALDHWFPTRFTNLNDRLVTQNGILLMGGASFLLMLISKGSVDLLIILYSINVFITFVLSQLGMVTHWWLSRSQTPKWSRKLLINGLGLLLTGFILISVIIVKFHEGGWATVVVTGALVAIAVKIKKHYRQTGQLIKKMDVLVEVAESSLPSVAKKPATSPVEYDPQARTAVILVNGYNGLGLHTLFNVLRFFEGACRSFVFVQVGIVDAGVFKGVAEIDNLKKCMQTDLDRYVNLMRRHGYYAESRSIIGLDVVHEILELAPTILARFPKAVIFGGQLVFSQDSFFTRLLHNYVVFSLQRQLYLHGIPFMIMPVRV